ncbi:thiol:disulfide interchange protein TlpA [Bosea caraganae]|nr:TlpA disulfide reductase family protein [Bosea caraganae]
MTPVKKISAALGLALVAAVGGAAAFYSGWGFAGNSACAAAEPIAQKLQPLARGEVAAAQVSERPGPLPNLGFAGPDGKAMTLADFKGKTVLVNLWATWCAPCKAEMPALDKLQAQLGGPDFEVIAVNIDTRDLDKPKHWLKSKKIETLAYYADPEAKIFQDLKAVGKAEGMPTTLVVSKEGCQLAILHGAADWSSQDALAFMSAAAGR